MKNLICPICKNDLTLNNKTMSCPKKHSFDIAKEGYVNLLPVNSKKSKEPGDNSKMTFARRNFLESDYYKPLANKIIEIIQRFDNKENILDLGCGEGYYTGLIADNYMHSNFTALDISKVAVKYGSKRYKNVDFCVASAFEMPIKDNSMDIVYRIYAPSLDTELNRVIKNGGYLITVTPGNRHLYQLREIIYSDVLNLSTKDDESKTLTRISSQNLHYMMNITNKQVVSDLLDMTPFGWKISEKSLEEIMNNKSWDIECDFKIEVFKKI